MKENFQLPIIAIIGRPNVGKSTFFNRLCGQRKAIESEIPHTTRDRIYSEATWNDKAFLLIDTAGLFEENKNNNFEEITKASVDIAIEQADSIIFLIDASSEVSQPDREFSKKLHKNKKKIFLVANKADNFSREVPTREMLSLGFGVPIFVSAISGRGFGDMLDIVTAHLPQNQEIKTKKNQINVAIIGRPNVGKSTLLNSLTGENTALVNEIAGTTRDPNNFLVIYKGKKIQITDTAGIRKRGKIEKTIEKYSVIRAIKAIEESNVVIVMVDAKEGVTSQDAHLAGLAKDQGKSLIIAVNKFDIWEKLSENEVKKKMSLTIYELKNNLAFLPYVPVIFISAKNDKNLNILLKKVVEVYDQRFINIPKNELDLMVQEAKMANQQLAKITYFYQEKTNPIVFKLICKRAKDFHFSHLRFLENFIRDQYPYSGTPIFIDLIER